MLRFFRHQRDKFEVFLYNVCDYIINKAKNQTLTHHPKKLVIVPWMI
jgi:hypothetical protein